IPDHALTRGQAEEHEGDGADLPATEALFGPRGGVLGRVTTSLEPREERRLLETHPDVDRDREQDRRDEERVAPAGAREVGWGHARPEDEDDCEREEEPDGRGGLDPRRVEAPPVVRRVLRDVDRRAAVLA